MGVEAEGRQERQMVAALTHSKRPIVRFPIGLEILLFITSAAQYTGASAVSLFLVLTLGYGPVETNDFWMYTGFVGWTSPIIGWLSDFFVVGTERRRPCLVAGLIFDALCLLLMSLYGQRLAFHQFILLALAQTFSEMLVFVPLNAMVVELCKNPRSIIVCSVAGSTEDGDETSDTRPKDVAAVDAATLTSAAGEGQSHALLLRSCGSLFGASLQTAALAKVAPVSVILGAAATFILALPIVLFLPKNLSTMAMEGSRRLPVASIRSRFRTLTERVRHSCTGGVIHSQFSGLVAVLMFVFVYSVMPGSSTIYYQFISVNFDFPAWWLSLNSALGLLSSILACYLYQRYLSRLNQTAVFLVGCACLSFGYGTNIMLSTGFSRTIGISDSVFVMVDTVVVSCLARIGFIPVLQIASARCPTGFEAFVFELFTATTLGASSVSALATSFIATKLNIKTGGYDKLWILLLICAIGKWVPVLFLACLPKVARSHQEPSAEQHPLMEDDATTSIAGSEGETDDEGTTRSEYVGVQ